MKMLRKIFWIIEDTGWNINCRYNFWLHGPYGLARVVEQMPFRFIVKYLRKYGATIGTDPVIEPGIIIHRPDMELPFKNLTIGNNIYIGHHNLFDLSDRIIIKDNVKLGAGCQLWTHTGSFSKFDSGVNLRYNEESAAIIIEDYTICYSLVIVGPGVTINEKCRVSAGSLVIKNVEANTFVGGVPARIICK
jgi:acetyltransferase-like isoleucine patch superfamily enzyme